MLDVLTANLFKMVIDDENAKVPKPLKFTKTKGNNAAIGEKHKEPSKVGYHLLT